MWLTQRHVHVGAIARAVAVADRSERLPLEIPILLSSLSQIDERDRVA
jgi:hypothetical protein